MQPLGIVAADPAADTGSRRAGRLESIQESMPIAADVCARNGSNMIAIAWRCIISASRLLYDALADTLGRIPKRSTSILTSSSKRPWTANGFGSSFNKAKHAAGFGDRDLNFNDLRGTAATRLYNSDIPLRVIAEILGWEEESVEKIIRRYIGRSSATKALIKKLNEAKRRT